MHAKKPQRHYQLWEGRVKAKTLRIALNKKNLNRIAALMHVV
jgi:hypothetical protein